MVANPTTADILAHTERRGECREWRGWTGKARPAGYAYVSRGGRTLKAAKIILEERRGGPLPPGVWSLHRCNNPPCVEPSHLYEGTAKDNSRDTRERLGYYPGSRRVRLIQREREEDEQARRFLQEHGLPTAAETDGRLRP